MYFNYIQFLSLSIKNVDIAAGNEGGVAPPPPPPPPPLPPVLPLSVAVLPVRSSLRIKNMAKVRFLL